MATHASDNEEKKPTPPAIKPGGWKAKLPEWISKPLSNPDDLKALFRCWIILFASTVLVFAHPSLRTLGNAALFVMILNFMAPANMPMPLFIFVFTTLILGMALAWAWGAAAVAAAFQARNQKLLASSVQRVQAGLASATRPDLAYQEQIFRGAFLDTRSSIVFGVFFGIGAFFFGVLRAVAPPLTLLSIFGTIVLDVMCSYAPLFPFRYYTTATQFLIPTACYIAIAFAGLILLFPRTLNHGWLNLYTTAFLRLSMTSISALSEILNNPTPLAASSWVAFDNAGLARRLALIGTIDGLTAQETFLDIEPVFGLLSGSDVKGLMPLAKEIVVGVLGLGSFVRAVRERLEDLETKDHLHEAGPDEKQLSHLKDASFRVERENAVGLDILLPLLASSTKPLRIALDDALSAATEWLEHANHSRWRPRARLPTKSHADRTHLLDALRTELINFRKARRLALLDPFTRFFNPETGAFTADPGTARLSGRTLYLCFALETTLCTLAEKCISLLEYVDNLETKRTRRRLWWPKGLRHLGTVLTSGRGTRTETVGIEGAVDPERVDVLDDDSTVRAGSDISGETARPAKKASKKTAKADGIVDLDARTPKTTLGRLGRGLFNTYMWFWSPEAVFGLRYTIVTLALWLPAVFPASAWINYTQKGLWALIMAQTGLGVYAGDQMASLVKRAVGTAAGLVLGMLIWYVGAGNGSNPYGVIASFMVFSVFMLFVRLFCVEYQMEGIMMTVTATLIIAYSYQDTVLLTLGNPGVGVNVAWRRALLVLIGIGAAFVVSMFPRPQSTRVMVRRTLATTTDELNQLYLSAVEAWIMEDPDFTDDAESCSPNLKQLEESMRARGLGILVKLKALETSLENAKWELSLRGPWPAEEYIALLQKQKTFFGAILQLSQAFKMLTPTWRKEFARRSALLNPNLVSEVSTTMTIIAHSLRSGTPLPAALPTPLVTRVLHHETTVRQQRLAQAQRHSGSAHNRLTRADDDDTPSLLQMEGITASGAHEITLDIIRDEQFQINASAAVAVLALLAQVDAMSNIVEKLAGKQELKGWAEMRAAMGNDTV